MTNRRDDHAARLRSLHQPGDPLVLPNVWDAVSATTVAAEGVPALATASAAISAMLGRTDHEGAPPEEMLAAAGRVTAAVEVPVTVDAEAGYGLAPHELVARLDAIGAAGCNLEDTDHRTGGLTDADTQARYLTGVRAAAREAGVDLVLNARVDVFLTGTDTGEAAVTAAVDRAKRYLDAGADCVYPILAPSAGAIASLTERVPGPVNVLCHPDGPGLDRLAGLGVARVSFGPGPQRTAMEALAGLARRAAAHEDPFGP
ncbi:2-methylisocitrate lyase-like PEP mutase family enzyme [Haloactinospora alba]|uniref:2-methylisocitrate lyase-like PEP mutase family enzyme n=1 Tax=Haloactinospora alba TaxID=405555 RepID=A0A543NN10_9ACTN|nr:isocitrate lyase/phosphoenolpyruvate mutase family protein [Haloactinospora alba]TQN33220.1 2-methylisocitrate lyase-like PEP mutase family enzyme [Haloactinospora alba]